MQGPIPVSSSGNNEGHDKHGLTSFSGGMPSNPTMIGAAFADAPITTTTSSRLIHHAAETIITTTTTTSTTGTLCSICHEQHDSLRTCKSCGFHVCGNCSTTEPTGSSNEPVIQCHECAKGTRGGPWRDIARCVGCGRERRNHGRCQKCNRHICPCCIHNLITPDGITRPICPESLQQSIFDQQVERNETSTSYGSSDPELSQAQPAAEPATHDSAGRNEISDTEVLSSHPTEFLIASPECQLPQLSDVLSDTEAASQEPSQATRWLLSPPPPTYAEISDTEIVATRCPTELPPMT